MILTTEAFKDVCSKILAAVDSNEISVLTETLELKAVDGILEVSVTNKEYFAKVKLNVASDDEYFHATVNANLFLKLISQMTTDTIELVVKDTSLNIKGNGNYKLPLIYDNEKLLELPTIEINNPTNTFDISGEVLNSILLYNSKELTKGVISKPVQKMYYVDNEGAITFTSGACVNSFTLPAPVKLLLNNRLVKLFKLFKSEAVKFTIGYDALTEDIIQTKVRFESLDISITAILSCDDSMINSVPAAAIRRRANNTYPYSVSINRDALIQALNRLLLFSAGIGSKEIVKPYGTFEFNPTSMTIYDVKKENKETINYTNNVAIDDTYELIIDLTDLKSTLEICSEPYLNMHFGDGQAVVISRGSIKNVIPQVKVI